MTRIAASQSLPACQPPHHWISCSLDILETIPCFSSAVIRHLVSGPRHRHQPVLQGVLRSGRHPGDDRRNPHHSRCRGGALPLDGEQQATHHTVHAMMVGVKMQHRRKQPLIISPWAPAESQLETVFTS